MKFIVCGTRISLNYEISNSNNISNNQKLRTNTKRNDNINKNVNTIKNKKRETSELNIKKPIIFVRTTIVFITIVFL